MLSTLQTLQYQGLGDEGQIALAGIWTALITTAAGLIVAIPSMIFYNYLTNKVNKLISYIESSAIDFIIILTKEVK